MRLEIGGELATDTRQMLEALGEEGRLPVEAIRAIQADRATMAPILVRGIDDFTMRRAALTKEAANLGGLS